MADYIDREVLFSYLEKRLVHHPRIISFLFPRIADLPSADVVEVVRCKDCKWWNKAGCAICIVDETDKPKENDFCSFGEKMDGKGEE